MTWSKSFQVCACIGKFKLRLSMSSCIILALGDDHDRNAWTYKYQQKQNRIHRSIQNIVHIVPTALLELFPICQEYFPHKRHNVLIQTEYISQMLALCANFPSLQLKIFDVIVAKCLEIDVEIVIEESGEVLIRKDEDAGGLFDDADDDDIFQLDDNQDIRGGSKIHSQGGIGSTQMMQIRDDVTEIAEKLDRMMCVLLKFLVENICVSSEDRIFAQIFNIFENRILSTYKSKFVQYIVFILCKYHPQRGE